ncbi:MAG: class I SAM-dependent methyltransferase family protein [Candidatus Hodarchaeota archaeon]
MINTREYSYGVGVPLEDAENARLRLIRSNQLSKTMKPIRKTNYVIFPILDPNIIPDLLKGINFVIEKYSFDENRKYKDIEEILSLEFPNVDFNEITFKYDQMGEIGVLKLDPDSTTFAFRRRAGELVMSQSPKIKVVVNKIHNVEGVERIYPIEYLAGEKITQSWHLEYGVFINFDIKTTYFNPRLAEEHNRVAMLGSPREKILDLFCGVGPFALHCAKRFSCRIIALDINTYAIYALKRSIIRNKLNGRIFPIIGEFPYIFQTKKYFDRIIMNLPQKSVDFLPYAIKLIKKEGIITLYQFIPKSERPEKDICRLIAKKMGKVNSYKVLFNKVGREVSPSKVQMNVDLQIV